jgi:glycosyl-4,4'-diaponeurosporenoate acyltransferase
VPLVDLSTGRTVLANVGFWAVVHAGTGYAVHRIPVARLERDGRLFRARTIEGGGRLYERAGIRRWKDRLPEAGALFAGGMSKLRLPAGCDGGIARFAVETRRAELGHWLALVAGPAAVVWNPPAGAVAMGLYGVAANLPCIAIQRFNRQRAQRVLDRSSGSRSDARPRR